MSVWPAGPDEVTLPEYLPLALGSEKRPLENGHDIESTSFELPGQETRGKRKVEGAGDHLLPHGPRGVHLRFGGERTAAGVNACK